jgi:RNA polymerase sigma-70 factor (ECF subfamily)
MTAAATSPFLYRPDLWSWLSALTERGDALCASSVERPPQTSDTTTSVLNDDLRDVRLTRDGDKHAFERIVRRHQLELARRLRRFSSDPLVQDELLHETFVQAFFSLGKYRADAPFINWLHRIGVRTGYRYWKTRRRVGSVAALDDQRVAAPNRSSDDELHDVLERLSPRDRLVVTLLYLEDRSIKEAADLAGWSQTMVRVQAFRARGRLRTLMREMEGER